MKILILGASGFLGATLKEILSSDYEVVGTSTSLMSASTGLVTFNYSGLESLPQMILKEVPDCIVNCIALADVDQAENNPNLANRLNFELPRDLSRFCETHKIRLIHISTDHFETPSEGQNENDLPIPVNIYGKSKLNGDLAILENNPSATILRTNFFARSRTGKRGLIDFISNSFNANIEITGYQDILFNPVGVHFLAMCIDRILNASYSGVLNIASKQLISKYEFLCMVAEKLNLDSNKIIARNYRQDNGSIVRPKCMFLNPSKLIHFLGRDIPSIESQLDLELWGTIPLLEIRDVE